MRRFMKTSAIALALSLFAAATVQSPAESFGPYSARRVVFLGDSITHAGTYINFIEARLRMENANRVPEIINLGLPSETCSGLSEPDHPFPRPDVHERLDRALAKLKPDLVFACYGMNDGIYYPFSKERFAAYQAGINQLIRKVKASGARLVLITPPPFDPLPLKKKGKLLPLGADKYAWFNIYEDYDSVLARYSEWLRTQAAKVDGFIDVRAPILTETARLRQKDPDLTLSGDGVHIDRRGHEIFANAVLKALKLKGTAGLDPALLQLVSARRAIMHLAWLDHVGHKRPGPHSKISFAEAQKKAAEIDRQIADWFAARK